MASSRWVEALLPVSECVSPKLPESSADALQGFDREGFAIAGAREMRPAVIARKTWGGNRSPAGAQAQRTLMSVLRTCYRQGKDSVERIVELVRSPMPIVLDIVPIGGSP